MTAYQEAVRQKISKGEVKKIVGILNFINIDAQIETLSPEDFGVRVCFDGTTAVFTTVNSIERLKDGLREGVERLVK